MAHGITDKDTAVFGEGQPAWHGLGTVVDGLMSTEEALALSGLDWEVKLTPSKYYHKGKLRTLKDRFTAVREDTGDAFDTVGTAYKPLQNADAFSFLDNLLDDGEAKIATAGSLWGGKRVFVSARLTDAFQVAGESMDGYMLVFNSHDGSSSLKVAATVVRPVCQNTVSFGLQTAKSTWTMSHRTDIAGKIQEARESLQLTQTYNAAFQDEVERLLAVELEKDKFLTLMKDVLPEQSRATEKKLELLSAAWEHETTPTDNTGWRGLNAFTFFTDHLTEYRDEAAAFKTVTGGWAAKTRTEVKDRILALA
jgi:phage/plasmid-like protein (TIGR03299 family)